MQSVIDVIEKLDLTYVEVDVAGNQDGAPLGSMLYLTLTSSLR